MYSIYNALISFKVNKLYLHSIEARIKFINYFIFFLILFIFNFLFLI